MGFSQLFFCNSRLFIFLCLFNLPAMRAHSPAEAPEASEQNLSASKEVILYALAIATFIVLGICFLYRAIRSRKCSRSPAEPRAYQIQFEAHELSVAARGYHKDYLIGSTDWASLFKAVLPDGLVVAIKRLNLNDSDEANQRFLEACIALTQVRHCNLVGVLGFSVSKHYKCIVTEYVDCESLKELLSGASCNLSWETRVKIALGTARALVYMHEECRVNSGSPLVHGDIKPSNIFVDVEEQEAVLSDYGITPLLQNYSGSSNFQGFCGYAAPECMRSEAVSAKSDVYSYGMVLLQMLTLKHPSSEQVSGNLPEWVRNKILHSYEEVLDPAIFGDATESRKRKIKKVMGLALMCTRHDPPSRPSMKDVAETLIQIKSFETHDIPRRALPVFGTDNV